MLSQSGFNDVLHPSKEEVLSAWARRVWENREQAERFREAPELPDFYAPTAARFKIDPRRTDEPTLNILLKMVEPGETWLDIGAGAGRYALPIALRIREAIAIDPSRAMLANLQQQMSEHGISNIRVIEGRWPVKDPLEADVALIANVAYDIEDIGSFLNAMEASTRRLCVAVLQDGAPSSPVNPFWVLIHGEERVPLPALREFLLLQIARGRLCQVQLAPVQAFNRDSIGPAIPFLRQQLFIEPGGEKDRLLGRLVEEQRAGAEQVRKPGVVGIVSWTPVH